MPVLPQTPGSEHEQAANDHDAAARRHRTAAEFYGKKMPHAGWLSSEDARQCCITAHRQSMLACEHSAEKADCP